MPANKSSIVAAIRGAFIGDAASMGTHWIYDPKKMAEAVPSVEAPEFKDPPTPSYYSGEEFPGHYGPGMLSPYGEQLLFVAEHIAKEGKVDTKAMSQAMLEWAESFGGRPDHATTIFTENMKAGKEYPECGADDSQAHCYMKAVPVTCLYLGKPERRAKVEEAIRVHQNNDMAVTFGLAASDILEKVLLGKSIKDALADLEGEAKAMLEKGIVFPTFEEELSAMCEEYGGMKGRSCALPGSFIAPMYLFNGVPPASPDYESILRQNILGAGDTCSRAVFIGAIMAAAVGEVPESWASKMDADTLARVDAAADKIADAATA